MLDNIDWLNSVALLWFLCGWVGYSRFAKRRAKQVDCLASVMHRHRIDWMRSVFFREIRVSDAAIIANLERNVSFMASTSMLVLAGLVTVLANSDQVAILVGKLPFVLGASAEHLQLKLLILVCMFIYAFFTFTWSLRQFGFCSVLIGASPVVREGELSDGECELFARHTGKVFDQASHSYNFGLRSYYFAMALLAWFIHPLLFMAAVGLVVSILYHREFHSNSLQALLQVNLDWHQSEKIKPTQVVKQT